MKISNLLNRFFYFWKLILFSDDLYSIILTNILGIFGHECWKVMIDYDNHWEKFPFSAQRTYSK